MKKLLSVILSLTMLVTTVAVMPFSTFAQDTTLLQLDELCSTYKSMVTSKLYTNEQAAYTAYENAVQSIDAVKYGGKSSTNFNSLYTALETAISNMTEFDPSITSYIPKSPASNTPVDSRSCSNLLYHGGLTTEVGNGDNDYIMTGVYMGDIVWAYDGVNELYAPVNSWQKWQKNWVGSTNYKCRYIAIIDTTDVALKDNWWQSKKTANDYYTRENCPGGQELASQTAELETFIFGNTDIYQEKTQYIASNTLKFNTDLTKENYKAYNLKWQSENNYSKQHSYDSTSTIYVINYKQLLDAANAALNTLQNVDDYTRATMTSYLGALDAATSYDITNYDFASDTVAAVTNAATDVNYKARAITETSLAKVSDYSDLRTAINNAKPIINAGQGVYTDESWNNLITKYNSAKNEMGILENSSNDYLTIDNQNRIVTIATELNEATTELQIIETNISFDVDGDTAVIKNIDAAGETVINIPSSLGSYDKIAIADGSFSNNSTVSQVNIPDTVQSVGDNAFSNCSSLKVIYVYSDTTTFGEGVFNGSSTPLIINCNPGSEAWKYAEKMGYKHVCLNHTYDSGTVFAPATCTVDGTMLYTCTDCGATKTEVIAKTGHSYIKTQTVAASCEDDGYDVFECQSCHDSYRANITPSLGGHDWVLTDSRAATCTQSGYSDYKCSKCNETKHEIFSMTDHNFGTATVVSPTCTAQGYTTKTCVDCNYEERTNYTNALGHDYSTVTNHVAATCTSDGYDLKKCSRCDATDKVYNHSEPALGHNYVPTVTPATCTTGGYTTYTCTRCDSKTIKDVTNALGHDYSVITKHVPATCTTQGYNECKCSRCSETTVKYLDNEPALGHSYTNYVSNNDATCTSDGTKTAKCDKCDLTNTVVDAGSALGHSYTAVVTPATCTTGGYTTYTCTRCGNSYQGNITAVTGHNAAQVMTPATFTTDGSKTSVCNNCKATLSSTAIPKVSNVTLSTTGYSYDKKKHTPKVNVKDSTGKVLVNGADYTAKYSNSKSKKIGYYTVTVTLMGNYTGTKKLTYTIGPKTTEKITSLKAGKKSFTVKYKKNKATTGYIVQYSTSSKFTSGVKTVTVKGKSTTKKTVKKLTKGKKYYVRVCTYKTVKGKKCLAAWSKTKSVKAK